MTPPRIEVMIITRDEAAHIADTVRNASQLGPVFVLDSFSTDGTQELARQAGATVVEHVFGSYAAQKNWGLGNLPFQAEWVIILDADERVAPALRDEILAIVASNPREDGFYVNRQPVFMGKPIRHGGLYPSWNLRLFRRGRASYEDRCVHEHMVCQGSTAYLRGHLIHIRYETISDYIAKHIRYADLESAEWVKMRLGRSSAAPEYSLFHGSLRFRQWFRRRVWPRLPCRPLGRFMHMYFFRLGFLDGRAGWRLAWLMACYEYMIGLLYREKLHVAPGGPSADAAKATGALTEKPGPSDSV